MIPNKYLFIAEKPSVARAFADAMEKKSKSFDGYMEGDDVIFTWCVGHLVTMSYPEVYDEKYKKWRMETLPFIPDEFLYEVISNVKKQFNIVSKLLNRADVSRIYVCTDSGREGEYIYRLVREMAGIKGKDERRVWINSQTTEEIKRGINQAKPLSDYNLLSDCAYLRAKEDYLMGINFSRVLSIRYGNSLAKLVNRKYMPISVGRVMTCVLGMVVRREREIRDFVKRPFYRVFADLDFNGEILSFEYKLAEDESELAGFTDENEAKAFILSEKASAEPFVIDSVSKKKEKKNPPLLYNLAELQNEASKVFKISPEETLNIVQTLYEWGLTSYPRTDARVISTAVAKEIGKNLNGLLQQPDYESFVRTIHSEGYYKKLAKSKYVDDSKITDHYAIIPTGEGAGKLRGLNQVQMGVYDLIVRRFLSVFFPESVSLKIAITAQHGANRYVYNAKTLVEEGYLAVLGKPAKQEELPSQVVESIKKGYKPSLFDMSIKKGETTPPKRYTSGSMILAMENAGKLIENEELRQLISGSGIGTSATRGGIIKKLCTNKYLSLNKKTQVLTPTLTGEMIHDIVYVSITPLLNPELTASWERGLRFVEEGKVSKDEYMEKLTGFIVKCTEQVKGGGSPINLERRYSILSQHYGGKNESKKGPYHK